MNRALVPTLALLAVASAGCSTGPRRAEDFARVLDREKELSCRELYDTKDGLEARDRGEAEELLRMVGCTSPDATRIDVDPQLSGPPRPPSSRK